MKKWSKTISPSHLIWQREELCKFGPEFSERRKNGGIKFFLGSFVDACSDFFEVGRLCFVKKRGELLPENGIFMQNQCFAAWHFGGWMR